MFNICLAIIAIVIILIIFIWYINNNSTKSGLTVLLNTCHSYYYCPNVLRSSNSQFEAILDRHGNFYIVNVPESGIVWKAEIENKHIHGDTYSLNLTKDGMLNVVKHYKEFTNELVYDRNKVIWTSAAENVSNPSTDGSYVTNNDPFQLTLQDNGILVITDFKANVIWSSVPLRTREQTFALEKDLESVYEQQ